MGENTIAILETAILYNSTNLVEEQYYSTENVLDKGIRNGLLQAIKNLTNEAFGEDIQSFSLGNYSIIIVSHDIEVPTINDSTTESPSLMMYAIVDKKTDEKIVIKAMNSILTHFLNRYSWNDIQNLRLKKFKKFKSRLEKIFGDLILRSEDRFKSLF